MRSSGLASVWATGSGHQTDAPEQSPEEAALRGLQWQVELANRTAQADRQRRLRALEVEVADQEQRARRDAERRQHTMRLGLARERLTRDSARLRPTVDLAQLGDVSELRIVAL